MGFGLNSAQFVVVEQSCKTKPFLSVFKVRVGFGVTAERTVGVLWAGTQRNTKKKAVMVINQNSVYFSIRFSRTDSTAQ